MLCFIVVKYLKRQKNTMSIALFVVGEDIMFHSEKTAKRLELLLKDANINFIPNEGHFIINQGDEIRKFLDSF